jgi:hypothetical protein
LDDRIAQRAGLRANLSAIDEQAAAVYDDLWTHIICQPDQAIFAPEPI